MSFKKHHDFNKGARYFISNDFDEVPLKMSRCIKHKPKKIMISKGYVVSKL